MDAQRKRKLHVKQHNTGLPKISQNKKRYWKEILNKKKPGKRKQDPIGVKIQDFRRLYIT